MKKIHFYKRFLRVLKIIFANTVFFFLRFSGSKNFFNYIYQFDPYPPKESKIEEVNIEDLFPGIAKNEIKLVDLESKYGSMTLVEIYFISLLVKRLNPLFIFEFGTFIGITTLQIAYNTDKDAKIFTLNLSSEEIKTKYSIGNSDDEKNLPKLQPGNRFENAGMINKIFQLYGDSAEYDYKDYFNKIDFVIVDASHEYEYVKSDTVNSIKMLKQGGTLVWHDYPNAPGVYTFLNELSSDLKIYHLKDTHICISPDVDKNKLVNYLSL